MFDNRLSLAVAFSLIIFILFAIIGVFSLAQNEEMAETLIQTLQNEMFAFVADDNPLVLAGKLFFNNLEASVLLFIGGATLGLLTIFILMTNGVIIGFVLSYASEKTGYLPILASIIPHGILEIPAFLIAAGLGFLLSESLWTEFKGQGDAAIDAKTLGRKFIVIVIPLLAFAAFIEAFITPQIIDLVLQGV
ncbi:stage II sporulation protein M [Methanomicrobium antiquum]|jgi:stage II sporulation protein M|uniref:Stage II sporulation protein M n=1 Tax=Methanomicrobium antiquum TaxID=487686 RepID=A0AAF0JNR6_9EURY|nr:stage II sporulation protein M [Methanomicrobium antiquum]MDD3977591.1 stage II sporulation protein M [Methanomicrobium sp.]WFN37661.1 stage II sporulation protein M [Methanomicrobium antiquum]